jgi:SAM-dependent methyltransferase
MKEKSLQKGWQWSQVDDLSYWQIPDGFVMNLPYLTKKPPAKVFDLGCGIGRHTVYFSSIGYEVVAMDIEEDAVKRTKNWLAKEDLHAEVYQGKMTDINQPDNHFDLVIAFNVIYHAFKLDVKKTIAHIYRILKPGGYFFGTLLAKEKNLSFSEPAELIDEQTLIKQDGAEVGVPHFFSYFEDLLEFFKEFEIVTLYYKEFYDKPHTFENYLSKKGWGHYIYLLQKPE